MDSPEAAEQLEVGKGHSMNSVKQIRPDELDAIRAKVGEIEHSTSAEVVCAFATESGNYDRAESIVGLVGGVVALVLTHFVSSAVADSGDWHVEQIGLFFQIAALIAGFVAGNWLAAYVFPLRRVFVKAKVLAAASERAANSVFNRHLLGKTKTNCGVLIYVSIFEKKLVLIADRACHDVIGSTEIERICESAARTLHEKQFVSAIENALDRLAEILQKEMPANRQLDKNEISNHVILSHRFN